MPAAASSTFSAIKRGDREIVITREFDAPRDLVFKVMFDPKLVPNWWGPRKYRTEVDTLDFRPGGKWRFLNIGAEGTHGFRGEFREIVPPKKVVWTFEWEGLPGHISVETMELEDIGGRTKLTATAVYANTEDRDGMFASGMETGARETYDRLDEVLAQQKKATAKI
jgi:uncharacterized protein YndB with AHSA1/START domain